MKRKALLIGNSNGLKGVKLDITNLSNFLKSDRGGAWYNLEIEILMNPTKSVLTETIQKIKKDSPDFSVVLFSGHGGYRKQTVLELNKDGETVDESLLLNIAPRQITILDCCRVLDEPLYEGLEKFTVEANRSKSLNTVRYRYDQRIMQAIPQQARLYSCSVGQPSYDTPNGAKYLNNLLNSAKDIDTYSSFKTVELAHTEAANATTMSTRDSEVVQSPEAILPKCLTSQQLIISIN
ncbi:caspase family protein [Shewanella xiamenensis]|uniref:caspase family protein n=1 Tax=Shewanella xiamenensis TaxID=332186 RepID=UPI00313D33EA